MEHQSPCFFQLEHIGSLKMERTVAPIFRSDVGDGFGEVPAVAAKVLGVVLALAIGLISGFSQNLRSVLPCPFAVSLGIFDPNLHDVRIVWRNVAFCDGETAVAGLHLDAVIGDAKTNREAKGL